MTVMKGKGEKGIRRGVRHGVENQNRTASGGPLSVLGEGGGGKKKKKGGGKSISISFSNQSIDN